MSVVSDAAGGKKGKPSVVTPVPDRVVRLDRVMRPDACASLLSSDFEERRAQANARFAAVTAGLRKRAEDLRKSAGEQE